MSLVHFNQFLLELVCGVTMKHMSASFHVELSLLLPVTVPSFYLFCLLWYHFFDLPIGAVKQTHTQFLTL